MISCLKMQLTMHLPSGDVFPKSPYRAPHISHTKHFFIRLKKLNRLKADQIDPECAYQWLAG